MNKRKVRHYGKRLLDVKPWYSFAILVACATVCVFALRSNNEHMIRLRDNVYTADMNNTNIQTSLEALQAYVTAHMNTNLSAGPDPVYPPIQLKYTYSRLVEAQSDAAQQSNAQLYTDAQQYCQQLDSTDFSGHNRVPCIEQYVETHNATAQSIPDSLYEFDFVSPTWSPDLAGWSLVASLLTAVLFVATYIYSKWFKKEIA
jgi:hypothetical protein